MLMLSSWYFAEFADDGKVLAYCRGKPVCLPDFRDAHRGASLFEGETMFHRQPDSQNTVSLYTSP